MSHWKILVVMSQQLECVEHVDTAGREVTECVQMLKPLDFKTRPSQPKSFLRLTVKTDATLVLLEIVLHDNVKVKF